MDPDNSSAQFNCYGFFYALTLCIGFLQVGTLPERSLGYVQCVGPAYESLYGAYDLSSLACHVGSAVGAVFCIIMVLCLGLRASRRERESAVAPSF